MVIWPCQAGQVAIVIDDIGYHQRDLDFLALPGQITYSILPHTPYANEFARLASAEHKEMLLHAPMESLEEKPLGPGALTRDMDKEHFQQTLINALLSLPGVKGVNNHMGSRLTQQSRPMGWTMEVLKQQGLYFLDSRTTNNSKAQFMANLYGVANLGRDIFLDNVPREKQLRFRFEQLKRRAKRDTFAVAIAHPYPETITFLQKALPELAEQGLQLVPLSELMRPQVIQLAAASDTNKAHGE